MKINKVLSSYYVLSFQNENDIIKFYKAFCRCGLFKIMKFKRIRRENMLEYCAKLPKRERILFTASEYCKLKKIKKHQFAALLEHGLAFTDF